MAHYNTGMKHCASLQNVLYSLELIKPLTPNPKLYSSREVVPISPMKSQTRLARHCAAPTAKDELQSALRKSCPQEQLFF